MHLKTAFFIWRTVNCIFIYIEWKGGLGDIHMQDFMNNGSSAAAGLKRSYQSLKIYLFNCWECKMSPSYLERKIERKVSELIYSIEKCIITKNCFSKMNTYISRVCCFFFNLKACQAKQKWTLSLWSTLFVFLEHTFLPTATPSTPFKINFFFVLFFYF